MTTKQEIEKLKKEHGVKTIFEIIFEDDTYALFSKPKRNQLSLILHKGQAGEPLGVATALVKNCYLGGTCTKEMLLHDEDTEYIAQLGPSVDGILQTRKREVKKH